MKQILTLLSIGLFITILSGCATWDGVKKDTSKAYDSTKSAIHEATK